MYVKVWNFVMEQTIKAEINPETDYGDEELQEDSLQKTPMQVCSTSSSVNYVMVKRSSHDHEKRLTLLLP